MRSRATVVLSDMTRGAGNPPRLCREGKLELTKAPRSSDRGGGNSRRVPPDKARKGRSGRRWSAEALARPSSTAEKRGRTERHAPSDRAYLLLGSIGRSTATPDG